MFRVVFLVPDTFLFSDLTPTQLAAVQSVFGQHVRPMPGTIAANGKIVIDGVANDNFDVNTLPGLGLPFEIIGLWDYAGNTLIPLDSGIFIQHLPPQETLDADGNVISTSPPVLHEPHRWSGWPALF